MSSRTVPAAGWVVTLLTAALAGVVVLAFQAEQNPLKRTTLTNAPGSRPGPAPSTAPKAPPTLPERSGSGRRVVYSLELARVWLVEPGDKVARTFSVWPGTVHPDAGSYTVTFRRKEGTGSDGVKIQNAVYFGRSSAFSNAVDGSSPPPTLNLKTGAIRERAEDGLAMWDFATKGTTVVVVQ
ncbi:hypothetical protein ACFVIM_29320 [Streptomyces sp. NPDC057638]|uniref:hypothetical protein n=1 Tax=Streptomyces sp. NPDC057638 TaxID=3346190 RepID=UPI003697D862